MKKILILLILSLCLVACTNTPSEPQTTDDSNLEYCGVGEDACEEEFNYDDFMNGDNVFNPITFKEAISLFENKESGIIYFGYSNCPWCVEAVPIMNEVAESLGKEIYYVATRDSDRNQLYTEEESEKILTYIGEYEDRDEEGNLHIYVPLVVVFEDGECVSGNLGTVDSHDAHERKMTEEEIVQLTSIYQEMFK